MVDFLKELTRRKVWLFGGLYLGLGWVMLQVAIAVEATMKLPDWIDQSVLVLLVIGFPFALLLAWAQESQSGVSDRTNSYAKDPAAEHLARELFRPASLAILPFDNLSDDPELGYAGDGLSEDLTTRLGMIWTLQIASRNSAFAFKGQSPDIREVGEKLNVRFVVEGSVRKTGTAARITAQLIETSEGSHLWADSWDLEVEKLGEDLDTIVDAIAGEVFTSVTSSEMKRIRSLPDNALGPWEFTLLGFMTGFAEFSGENLLAARPVLKRGVERFPGDALLHAQYAHVCAWCSVFQWDERDAHLKVAEEHLAKALSLDSTNFFVQTQAAHTKRILGRHNESLAHAEKILATPEGARMEPVAGQIMSSFGRFEEARDEMASFLKRAGARHWQRELYLPGLAHAHMGLGEYDIAEEFIHEAIRLRPTMEKQRYLIALLALQGKQEELEVELARLRTMPGFDEDLSGYISWFRSFHAKPALPDLMVKGLVLAGLWQEPEVEGDVDA